MRAILAFSTALVFAACQSHERNGDIHVDLADKVSFEVPKGYRLARERDAWLLVGEDDLAGSTIAIRSVPRAEWSERNDPLLLTAATAKALHAYPGASVRGPSTLDETPYPGFAFDVTFQPRSKNGDRYRRRHATLISSGRIFHVIETWPATAAEAAKRDFHRVLRSVREEG